jgi:hypothetical protein
MECAPPLFSYLEIPWNWMWDWFTNNKLYFNIFIHSILHPSKINTEESDRTHDIQNKHYTSSDSMKLQILVDQYVFAFNKPARTQRLFNVDIYKAIGSKAPFECIKGIQRIRDTWRIFMDNSEDRITLIVEVLNMRGMWVPIHTHNSQRIQPDTIRIKENV